MKPFFRRWFLDSSTGVACFFFLVGTLALWLHVAVVLPLDYWDSLNFILQSRRLTDPAYDFVAFDPWRPRGLVAFLAVFDVGYHFIFGRFPGLVAYRLLMVALSFGFVATWMAAHERLWGRKVAVLATLFLLSTEVLHHYAAFVLADMLTGLFWGIGVTLFVGAARDNHPISYWRAVALGVAGAMVGGSKYHFLPFVPVLLIAYLTLGGRLWTPRLLGVVGLAFLATLELLLRVFSGGETGIWGQVLEILAQAQDMKSHLRPPDLYLDALGRMFGPAFWVLGATALALIARRSRPFTPLHAERGAVLVACGVLAILTQALSQREVRYLFPLLPVLLGVVAWAAITLYGRLPVSARRLWVFLWALALVHPLWRSANDLSTTLSDPVSRAANQSSQALWTYLKIPSVAGHRCSRIEACGYSVRSATWEFKKDEYYRRYDLGPHYSFHTQLPWQPKVCPRFNAGEELWAKTIPHLSDRDACYVLLVTELDPSGASQHLAVVKKLGDELSEKAARAFESMRNISGEDVRCETQGKQTFRCWSVAKFMEFPVHVRPPFE